MNKKVYGILFTSIFILSTVALMAKPVTGSTNWKLGIPDAAKGIETEAEVKVSDKSEWGHHIGNDPDDRINQKHGNYKKGYTSNADDVGSKTKSKILDWEKDEIWWMGDYLLHTKLDESIRLDPEYDRTGDAISDLQTYWDAVPFARNTILGLAGNYLTAEIDQLGPYDKPLIGAMYGAVNYTRCVLGAGALPSSTAISQAINDTQGMGPGIPGVIGAIPTGAGAWASTFDRAAVTAGFAKKYDGYILERDLWYWADNGDYESDEDEKEATIPFIEDPEDYRDSYDYFVGFTEILFDQVEAIIADMDTFIGLTGYSTANPGGAHTYGDSVMWNAINSTLGAQLGDYSDKYVLYMGDPVTYAPYVNYYNFYLLNMSVWKMFGADYVFAWYYVVRNGLQEKLVDFFRSKVPDRAEYLILLLRSGIPAHQPVEKWLDQLADAFDIDEDTLWDIGGDPFKLDVSVDGKEITLGIEWQEGVMWNPGASVLEQREDYKMVFTYSDTGGQSSMTYKGSDPFYKTESLAPVIPGYEISILLGAAAISALALIYIVMKKRKM